MSLSLAVHGCLTNWTNWSDCDSECGFGQQEKTRSCSNPTPQHGGDGCSGEIRKLQDCIMPDCPGNLNYTAWSGWSTCSVSCGSGVQTNTRYCLSSTGDGCEGPAQETKECLFPPCPGKNIHSPNGNLFPGIIFYLYMIVEDSNYFSYCQ